MTKTKFGSAAMALLTFAAMLIAVQATSTPQAEGWCGEPPYYYGVGLNGYLYNNGWRGVENPVGSTYGPNTCDEDGWYSWQDADMSQDGHCITVQVAGNFTSWQTVAVNCGSGNYSSQRSIHLDWYAGSDSWAGVRVCSAGVCSMGRTIHSA